MNNLSRTRVILVLLCSLALASSANADLITNGGCVDDVTEAFYPNRVPTNCTANDVTFAVVGLGIQSDGCVDGTSDTLSIRLRATVRNTTAQARYDVGLYFATDGDPNADGATTGTCARINLQPVGATGVNSCTASTLDLDGPASGVDNNVVGVADGPYLNAETGGNNSTPDLCGDLFSQGISGCDENGDGSWDDTVLDFPSDITLPCSDSNGDGFANIPTCATWGNQANEVHDDSGGDTCESAAELVPGTKAKCRCENTNTTIPVPQISCTASCSPLLVQPGETTTCSVTYTNSVTCVPDPNTPERFRCGTGSFLRLKTDYDQANGSITQLATTGSGSGGTALDDGNQIVWTPSSDLGTAGLVAQGESATMTFDYTVDPGASNDLTLNFSTSGFWADASDFSSEVEQTALTCGASITTPVTLASFQAEREKEGLSVAWTTATEIATVGFQLYEELSDGWRLASSSVTFTEPGDSTVPRSYRVEIPDSPARQVLLESLNADGTSQFHGPFEIGKKYGKQLAATSVPWLDLRSGLETGSRSAKPGRLASKARRPSAEARPVAALEVSQTGIHRLTFDDLLAAGIDFTGVSASHLALTQAGNPIEAYVDAGAENGQRFGPGGYIEFFGEALDTLYTTTNVYRLGVDPSQARRIGQDSRRPGAVAAAHYPATVERRLRTEYNFGSPFSDPWSDTRMLTFGGTRTFEFSFDADRLVDHAAAPRLELDYWGGTDLPEAPDHHVRVLLNGTELDDRTFDGITAQQLDLPLPPGLLQAAGNRLVVELPGDLGVVFDLVNFEGFRLTYPRSFVAREGQLEFSGQAERFDVAQLPTGPVVAYRIQNGEPTRLTQLGATLDGSTQTVSLRGDRRTATYYISAVDSLVSPTIRPGDPEAGERSTPADVLVVTHPLFTDSLSPWLTHHEASGLRIDVVTVDEVYSRFSGGVVNAQAIADYIRVAAREQGIRSVVLVGGDSYDYRNDLGLDSVSFIPSLYAPTGDLIQFAPVDPLYTDLDGDRVPDLPIGRFPVRSVEELDDLIGRTLEYGDKSYERTALLVADAFDAGAGVSFANHSEELRRNLGDSWQVQRAYLDTFTVPDARQVIVDTLDQGTALTSFAGHSGPLGWTFSGLFSTADARALTNAGKPTVVVQWGCWNTYHVEPRFDTLGHAFLLSGDRGAAAVLGSSTLTESSSTEKLANLLIPLLTQPGKRLGEAVTEAKAHLARTDPELADVLLGWTILGDPLLVVVP